MYWLSDHSEEVMCKLDESHKVASQSGLHFVNLFWVDPWGMLSNKDGYFPEKNDANWYADRLFDRCIGLKLEDFTDIAVYVDGVQRRHSKNEGMTILVGGGDDNA